MNALFQTSPDILTKIAIWALPILFAITLHEAAHGWVASKFGDKTALMMGRVTLNPLKHIDLVGTILIPILFLMLGGIIFGWAKPVPVDWRNLRNFRIDAPLVALAGPFSNLLMALMWAGIAKLALLGVQGGTQNYSLFVLMGVAGVQINLMLMILNLIPIPPLDGSRVIQSLLPQDMAYGFDRLAPYGMIILVLLLVTGVLFYVIEIPFFGLYRLISNLFGLPFTGF